MVLGQILKVGTVIIKHRKAIYAVLTAQDRYISKSFRYGGYGKATSYGVRSGALGGSIAGAFLNQADDTPGNAIQKPFTKEQPTPGKSNQTRRRPTTRSKFRKYKFCRPRRY